MLKKALSRCMVVAGAALVVAGAVVGVSTAAGFDVVASGDSTQVASGPFGSPDGGMPYN
ncbi:hypothetical protein [Pseudonocardia spinosispora]|uniref:hypothetical protein n=1 Tax=Pseudonocardia spinosispora TaxID=103441 RepID=UPI00041430CA|nr:hypothetical protein [Pseudonocardia spinosispora]